MTLYSYGTCLAHRRQPPVTKSNVIESFTNHGVEVTDGLKKRQNFLAFWGSAQLKDQQTHFGLVDVILLHFGQQHVDGQSCGRL
jgi:hypothetical protein